MSSLATVRSEEVLRRAYNIGNYYGFIPFPTLAQRSKEHRPPRRPYPSELKLQELDPMARIVASFLKQVRDAGLNPSVLQPIFSWHTNVTPGRPAPRQVIVQFHAIGSSHAIADTVLIKAAHAFATDILKSNLTLHLNSIGDRETRVRFARELSNYFRKHEEAIPSDCVECAKRDIFEATESLITHTSTEDIPSSVNHLSESSRKHFENVLEFLEETSTPYTLTPKLISRAGVWAETCFELRDGDERIAWGSRYQDLTGHFFETPIPSATVIVRLNTTRGIVSNVREPKKPHIIFMHIGNEAKRAGILLTEDLRKARVPLSQMIGVESLTEQMRLAETINPEYILIMGRKEVFDGVALLRNHSTHTETVIPLESIVETLKELSLK